MADFSVEQIDGLVNTGRLDPQTAEMMKVNYGLVPAASQQPQEISTLVPAYPVDHTPNTAQFDTPLSNAAPPPIQAMNPSAGVGADGTPMQMGPSGNVISPTAPQAPAPTPPLPQGQVDVGPITTSQPPPQQNAKRIGSLASMTRTTPPPCAPPSAAS